MGEASGLSEKTIEIVKATAPVMADKGYEITKCMYAKMLGENEDVRALFNPSHQIEMNGNRAHQPWSLASAIHAYACNIDNLGALGPAVNRIAEKHVSLSILPEHYPVVGQNLMHAVKEVLGDAATEDVCNAWLEAYLFLANVFIGKETEIREARSAAEGGWDGWKNFTVKRKAKESEDIVSFYLSPADGGKLPMFKAGAYTAIRVPCKRTQRNYSISSKPGEDFLRITVKRTGPSGKGAPVGCVSTWLHDRVKEGDTLELGVPCGDFLLDDKSLADDKPLVFISGGVGITPIIAMLESAISSGCEKDIVVIAAARDRKVEAMHEVLMKHDKENPNVSVTFLYGKLRMNHIRKAVGQSKDKHYYFCGPAAFMKVVYSGLKSWNIPEDQVHFEFFGPHRDLLSSEAPDSPKREARCPFPFFQKT
eukprot:CAMPEP_0197471532 /NCGR_PEP_ID=MMETSP1309-20131121/2487_1 /TAXON_ID=464262 /ORGANISM="Genus nov. species nov., Strain RCC998" /LENGTH=422 /DNA_ID=CAMNT_0043009339 /DNA_START=172 /DNA_END=1440 /DNA_ORIENTATION=-